MVRRYLITGLLLLLLNVVPHNQPYLIEANIIKKIFGGALGASETALGTVGESAVSLVQTAVDVGESLIHGVGRTAGVVGHGVKEMGHKIVTGGDEEKHFQKYHSHENEGRGRNNGDRWNDGGDQDGRWNGGGGRMEGGNSEWHRGGNNDRREGNSEWHRGGNNERREGNSEWNRGGNNDRREGNSDWHREGNNDRRGGGHSGFQERSHSEQSSNWEGNQREHVEWRANGRNTM